ncbi:MAG: hypothetical protein LIO64_10120 [Akkermansia sp.]|nr:hypothetical protein [Akkermansia sp.]
MGTIEGNAVFSKDIGGRFILIVRRQADKLQVKPSLFKYAWSKEGKRQPSFELEPKNQQAVTVTLRRNDHIDSAISCTLKCDVTQSNNTKVFVKPLRITMTNLPPKP